MKKRHLAIASISALISLVPFATNAGSDRATVRSFTDMVDYVKKSEDRTSTLVVMDDDDTLTMMSCPDRNKPDTCQYLGGPAWFSWQQAQIEQMAQPRVANTFDGLLTVSSLLLSVNNMPYTAEDVPVVLNNLTATGVRLLVETARGNNNVSATENQFSALNTENKQYGNLLSLVSNNSLTFSPQTGASKPSPYQPCTNQSMAPITYQQGAMYLSGQNKGTILKCMLNEYNAQPEAKKITHVVFIDDTEENVINVEKAFEKSEKYTVYALHYTKLKRHKKALTKGEMADVYQANAMKRWRKIKSVLEGELLNPMIP